MISGKIEESTTRRPLRADHAAFRIDHGIHVVGRAHAARAAGMIGALHILAHEVVERRIGLRRASRRDLVAAIAREGRLRENLARQADGGAEIAPVLRRAHVVEADRRRRRAASRDVSANVAARGRAHRPDMHLEAVRGRGGAPVVADGAGQEMQLQVGVGDARRASG